jgi:hypothetical protein
MAKIFYTPPGYSGNAELTASTGLAIINQGLWQFSQSGYNDDATFGLGLTHPRPLDGGELHLSATNWPIAVIGNTLQSYTNPTTGETYPASQCRIQLVGRWVVIRQQNSNSFNSQGCEYTGRTTTDLGDRAMVTPNLLTYASGYVTYTIQGADVTGGAINNFSSHEFYCRVTESCTSDNSNKEFQSNTITTPSFNYTYVMSWEIDI